MCNKILKVVGGTCCLYLGMDHFIEIYVVAYLEISAFEHILH
jgi:hypothetical protein